MVNTRRCTSAWWIRIEPPPISLPLHTMSYAYASASPGDPSKRVDPVGVRRRERVMYGGPADLVAGVVDGRLEHRRVDHPAERPGALVDQTGPAGDLDARRAEQLLRLASRDDGGEEHRVARLRADRVGQTGQVRVGEVLRDRTAGLAGLGVEHDVREAPGAPSLRPVLPAVELLAGLRRRRRA